jgi:hypothetical protein
MNLKSEADVKKEVKKILNKYKVFWFMPQAGTFGSNGIPDFICCINGHFLAIETKSPEVGERPTSLQKKQLDAIRQAEGVTMCICDEKGLARVEKHLVLLANK